jgi:hypothetical protein
MNASEEQLERLRRFNRALSGADRGLNEEVRDELPQTRSPKFVFGNYVSPQLSLATQVPIRTIEIRSGIDFGNLASHDPMSLEGVITAPGPLLAFDEIRFV